MIAYFLRAFEGPAAPFMFALLAVLALALAVIVDRAWALRSSASPVERVVAAGAGLGTAADAERAMEAATIEAELSLRRRLGWLGTIASVATMIGLFGTVYGLIVAFAALGDVGAAERAARLAEGTSTSMATTAFGLFVAIPAMLAHAVLDGLARDRVGAIDAAVQRALVGKSSG